MTWQSRRYADIEKVKRNAARDFDRSFYPEGAPRQLAAIYASGRRTAGLQGVTAPTLVIHGGQDFRIPYTQGISTFTALQRKGIPSKFLYFPDENHWVLKPQNAKLWHKEVFAWLDKYIGTGPSK